ncbi:MAG: hypothetical protein IIW65_06480, partial [Alistipes sp.]|nr:hypothetical protein [Alistipes sp.]
FGGKDSINICSTKIKDPLIAIKNRHKAHFAYNFSFLLQKAQTAAPKRKKNKNRPAEPTFRQILLSLLKPKTHTR